MIRMVDNVVMILDMKITNIFILYHPIQDLLIDMSVYNHVRNTSHKQIKHFPHQFSVKEIRN